MKTETKRKPLILANKAEEIINNLTHNMEFFTSIGILAVLAIIVLLVSSREDNKRNEIEHLRQLAAMDGAIGFEKFWKSHNNLTYEQALRAFYKDPKKLAEAEEEKKSRDDLKRKLDERVKKENTIKRVYAYKYEDFVFSLFSPLAYYSSFREEWDEPSFVKGLPENYILHRMKELGSKDTYELYCEFLNNGLFYRDSKTKKVALGFVLSTYANIISEEDMNMDKWIKKNGQTQSKEELLADVDAYEESLY